MDARSYTDQSIGAKKPRPTIDSPLQTVELSEIKQSPQVDPVAEAEVYLNYNEVPKAIKVLENAIDESPENMRYYYELHDLYKQQNNQLAITQLADKLSAVDPSGALRRRYQQSGTEVDEVFAVQTDEQTSVPHELTANPTPPEQPAQLTQTEQAISKKIEDIIQAIKMVYLHQQENVELGKDLLDIYYAQKNRHSFDELAAMVHMHTNSGDHPVWQEIQAMGAELNPANSLYRTDTTTTHTPSQPALRPLA